MKHPRPVLIALVLATSACGENRGNPEVDASPRISAATRIAHYVELGASENPRSQDPWHFEVEVALVSLRDADGGEIFQATLATNYAVAVLPPDHPFDPAHVDELLRDIAAAFSGDKQVFRSDCWGCHLRLE